MFKDFKNFENIEEHTTCSCMFLAVWLIKAQSIYIYRIEGYGTVASSAAGADTNFE